METSFAKVRKDVNLSDDEVRRLVKRCVKRDAAGNINGFFAVVPFARLKEYERRAPTHEPAAERSNSRRSTHAGDNESPQYDGMSIGFAGALDQLLLRFPDVRDYLHEQCENPEEKVSFTKTHAGFLKMLRGRVSDNEWPFNVDRKGYSAVTEYLKEYIAANPQSTDLSRHGKATAAHRGHDPAKRRILPEFRALQGLEMDYNKVDAADTFIISLPNGTEVTIPVRRWYWGAISCSSSGAVLGIHFGLEREPSASSAMAVAGSVLRGIRLKASDWQLTYTKDGKVLINCFFPELVGHGMAYIKVDRAWANKCVDTVTNLSEVFGCALGFGRVYRWISRDVIESIFRRVSAAGPKATSFSYGTGPQDSARFEPLKAALKERFTTEHLVALLIGSVADVNTSPSRTLDGLSPVIAIGQMLKNPHSGIFPMRVPKDDVYPDWMIGAERTSAIVRNGGEIKRPACVNKYGCEYHHWELSGSDKYVGKRLLLFINRENANEVFAVLDGGQKVFGLLEPETHWAKRPHSIAIRKAIVSNYRKLKAAALLDHDPVVALGLSLAAQALGEGRNITQRTSNAALELARYKIQTGISILPFDRLPDSGTVHAAATQNSNSTPPYLVSKRDAETVEFVEEQSIGQIDISRFALLDRTIRRRREED